MGEENIRQLSSQNKTEFMHHLICDIKALEQMVQDGLIESGVTRIGAEQELCLVGEDMRPAVTGNEILRVAGESHFTSELALWNLEINLDPCEAGPGCLQGMHNQLDSLLHKASQQAKALESAVALTGILPTIRRSDLDLKYMTPSPRFKEIDRILREMRGEDFSLFIEGVDEVHLKHSSILFEACNTSFQVHLQVDPDDFSDKYNWAQVVAGPILAICANSPILLGRELWSETRIALFRQSIETRRTSNYVVDRQPRVAFGRDWIKSSVAEIFKNDMATYNLIIAADLGPETSLDVLSKGGIPKLKAMNLHNGTLYKWNRACYGLFNGNAHLRIENRYIPAGPTAVDEIANVALWIGLMESIPEKCKGRWEEHMRFQDVRCNFLKAARNGLSNEMRWFDKTMDVGNLVLNHLLPMAAEGLQKLGLADHEYGKYLDIIKQRVINRQTGASWMIESLRSLREKNSLDDALLLITRFAVDHCLENRPVHEWEVPQQNLLARIPDRYLRVDSIMANNVVTVREDDLLECAETLMGWTGQHHLPVENSRGEIVGVISIEDVQRAEKTAEHQPLVADYMASEIIAVTPETSVRKAEKLMQANDLESLPIVRDNHLIGIVTAKKIRAL